MLAERYESAILDLELVNSKCACDDEPQDVGIDRFVIEIVGA